MVPVLEISIQLNVFFFLPLKLINVSVNNNSNQTKIIMWHLLLTTVSNPIFAPSNVGSNPMYAVQIFFAGYVLIVNKVSIHKPKITKNYRGISCMHVIEVCRCVFQTNPVKNVFLHAILWATSTKSLSNTSLQRFSTLLNFK